MGFEFSSPLRDTQDSPIPKVSCKFTGFMGRSLPRCAQPTCAGKSMKRKPQPELQGHGRCRAMPPRSRVMSRMPRRARRKGGIKAVNIQSAHTVHFLQIVDNQNPLVLYLLLFIDTLDSLLHFRMIMIIKGVMYASCKCSPP